jgi:hypothetical protein
MLSNDCMSPTPPPPPTTTRAHAPIQPEPHTPCSAEQSTAGTGATPQASAARRQQIAQSGPPVKCSAQASISMVRTTPTLLPVTLFVVGSVATPLPRQKKWGVAGFTVTKTGGRQKSLFGSQAAAPHLKYRKHCAQVPNTSPGVRLRTRKHAHVILRSPRARA